MAVHCLDFAFTHMLAHIGELTYRPGAKPNVASLQACGFSEKSRALLFIVQNTGDLILPAF